MIISIPDTVAFSTIGADDGVLLDVGAGLFYSLSATAAHLWAQWMQDGTVDRSIDGLVAAFDIDRATAERDAFDLIEVLQAKGLLTVAAAA